MRNVIQAAVTVVTMLVVVGSTMGVFISTLDDLGNWIEYGTDLPNALVYELDYSAGSKRE